MNEPLLEVRDLTVEFPTRRGPLRAVNDVSFTIDRGEILGLVGESGSGKSVTSLALMGLTEHTGGRVVRGSVRFDGRDLLALSPRARAEILGRDLGMIFQQPVRSLNPTMRVGDQIAEVVRRHRDVSRAEARDRAIHMLDRVRIPDPARRARDYPHTFSGGMCQRVMIAMALACEPKLLIADEPTTALDVTVQAHVLDLLTELRADTGIAVLLITHDLGVIAHTSDRIAVMYCGQIVETGPVRDVLHTPSHPYTEGLLAAIPVRGARTRLVAIPGTVPPPDEPPPGCRFHPRCPHSRPGLCDTRTPELRISPAGRPDRCHHPHDAATPRTASDTTSGTPVG
ncbi:ABC transporter ATP-binding protein [Pseudonocardia kunmingensis]|uniref:Peptide/nickel transport system ATP-binding protein n=1 Tax=Pseudonocardia kunmingensis TaxID=630975 RepID=A0A543DPU4_9PSEU|nr:ABC transporter ATP-binding protein [Pseudonocardia kunmingensis]TQM11357.1 peptide/nickel transport system ATP-binding protein [Pseudonocardia kunmingensis]